MGTISVSHEELGCRKEKVTIALTEETLTLFFVKRCADSKDIARQFAKALFPLMYQQSMCGEGLAERFVAVWQEIAFPLGLLDLTSPLLVFSAHLYDCLLDMTKLNESLQIEAITRFVLKFEELASLAEKLFGVDSEVLLSCLRISRQCFHADAPTPCQGSLSRVHTDTLIALFEEEFMTFSGMAPTPEQIQVVSQGYQQALASFSTRKTEVQTGTNYVFSAREFQGYGVVLEMTDFGRFCAYHLAELFMHAFLGALTQNLKGSSLQALQSQQDLQRTIDNMLLMTYRIVSQLPGAESGYKDEVLTYIQELMQDRWAYWKAAFDRISNIEDEIIDLVAELTCTQTPREQLAALLEIESAIAQTSLPQPQQQHLLSLLSPLAGVEVCASHTSQAIFNALLSVARQLNEANVEERIIGELLGETMSKVVDGLVKSAQMRLVVREQNVSRIAERFGLIPIVLVVEDEGGASSGNNLN